MSQTISWPGTVTFWSSRWLPENLTVRTRLLGVTAIFPSNSLQESEQAYFRKCRTLLLTQHQTTASLNHLFMSALIEQTDVPQRFIRWMPGLCLQTELE